MDVADRDPLFRLVSRLAQVLNMQPEERQVLQAGCYLLELAMGRVAPALELQIPEGLLREAARILMYLHSPWDGVQRSQGLSNERIPRAAHVLQVAQYFIAAIEAVEGRSARSIEEALREIAAQTQQRFDPMVVEALFALRDWLSNELTA